jgi:hypothetical protein
MSSRALAIAMMSGYEFRYCLSVNVLQAWLSSGSNRPSEISSFRRQKVISISNPTREINENCVFSELWDKALPDYRLLLRSWPSSLPSDQGAWKSLVALALECSYLAERRSAPQDCRLGLICRSAGCPDCLARCQCGSDQRAIDVCLEVTEALNDCSPWRSGEKVCIDYAVYPSNRSTVLRRI